MIADGRPYSPNLTAPCLADHCLSPSKRLAHADQLAGRQISLPWTASGRLLLAHMTPTEIEALVQPEDLVPPDNRGAMKDFIADCVDAYGGIILATSGQINGFAQRPTPTIFGVNGEVGPRGSAFCARILVCPYETIKRPDRRLPKTPRG